MNSENLDENSLRYERCQVEGDCILKEIKPIRLNILKAIAFCIGCLLLGMPILLIYWQMQNLNNVGTQFLNVFSFIISAIFTKQLIFFILNYDDQISICKKMCKGAKPQENIWFQNRYLNYIVAFKDRTVRLNDFNFIRRIQEIMLQPNNTGYNQDQVKNLRQTFGDGGMKLKGESYAVLFLKEICRPLYLFLIFSTLLWMFHDYHEFAYTILGMSLVGILINVYQIDQSNKKNREMAEYDIQINVLRQNNASRMSSMQIVPGDIVFLKENIKLPFDGVILEGNVVVNQCSLTGQSLPVSKKYIEFNNYQTEDLKPQKSNILFEGTKIIQINLHKKFDKYEKYRQKLGVPICVMNTNFRTYKGQLVRTILFPKQRQNRFQIESMKFLQLLFVFVCVAFIGISYINYEYVFNWALFIKYLDLVTIAIPPALPVSMTFGIIYAMQKLKHKNIICMSQNKIIAGGSIDLCCFDKTGTLTEDFMELYCLRPSQKMQFQPEINISALDKQNYGSISAGIRQKSCMKPLLSNMASNHSILELEDGQQLIGDPMQIRLFEFGDFKFKRMASNDTNNIIFSFQSKGQSKPTKMDDRCSYNEGYVATRFEFESELQRMSVVGKNTIDNGAFIYCKGSPEVMKMLMQKQTIPLNYELVLKSYTSKGYRVLAMARKPLSIHINSITREIAESSLEFNGFVIFKNLIKKESSPTIKHLNSVRIKSVMITGDNATTAAQISYQCSIADSCKGLIIYDYLDGKIVQDVFKQVQTNKQGFREVQTNNLENSDKFPNDIKTKKENLPNILDESVNFQLQQKLLQQEITNSSNQVKESHFRNIFKRSLLKNYQICLTGNAFDYIYKEALEEGQKITVTQEQILRLTTTFARTSPDMKTKIVKTYQDIGYQVSMCGDGANDCGALKQANIGLSFCSGEGSISAAFTTSEGNISAMIQLIKECRAGLATNFSLFNIMVIYSLIMFSCSLIAQVYLSYFSNWNFMYWDFCLNFIFIIFIGRTSTADTLTIQKPNHSLIQYHNIRQIFTIFIIQLLGQLLSIWSYAQLFDIDGYYSLYGGVEKRRQKYLQTHNLYENSLETNVIFLYSNYIYIFTMITFHISRPWKKQIYTNYYLLTAICLTFIYSTLIILIPSTALQSFQVNYVPFYSFRWFIFALSLFFSVFIYFTQIILEKLSVREGNQSNDQKQ